MTTRRPPGYPVECEGTFRLEDGREVWLRPIVPDDLEQLKEAIRTADPATIRSRFLGGSAPTSPEVLERLVTVDFVKRHALVAFAPDGTGVGIARYEGEDTWPAVDLAVVVDPRWRGVGLGRELVNRVVRRAADQGATSLLLDFYADNARVNNLLEEAHLPVQRHIERGVVQDEVAIDPESLSRLELAPGA